MKKYVAFKLIAKKPKTNVYAVIKKPKHPRLNKPIILHHRPEEILGEIRWYAPWRQYCFFPDELTVFSRGRMRQINEFIDDEKA